MTSAKLRRIIVDVPRHDLEKFEHLPDLGALDSFRVVQQFRFDPKALAGICRVKFRSPSLTPACMVGYAGLTKVTALATLEDGSFLAYFEGKPTAGWAKLVTKTGGHLVPPFELTAESWKITLLGTSTQLQLFMSELRRRKIHYRVSSVGDVDFREKSPLAMLTTKQREALVAAYRGGYYDIPRRASSTRVAKALGLGKSTTVEHLRKAEKRLLDGILRD
jgi:hypothetical protein